MADPVQGGSKNGTTWDPPPVIIGGRDASGILRTLKTASDGSLATNPATELQLLGADGLTLAIVASPGSLATYASGETSSIYAGTTALTPKFAKANVAASSTDSSIIAAVTSKKLRVVSLVMVCGATATNITFNTKPGGAGTAISMLFANAANGGAVLGYNPVGWFETSSGEGLTATTGAGSTTGVQITYIEV